MPKPLPSKKPCQRGVALVIVLWVVSLLALIAGSFALTMRRDSSVANALISNAKAQALAQAGLAYAQFMLTLPDPKQRWKTDGTVYRLPQASGEVRIAIYAESGKIDLNASNEQQLTALFSSVTDNTQQQRQLVDAVLDWRDVDDEPRPNGAERKQYQQAGLHYAPTNSALQSLQELQQVLGMNEELFTRLEPLITVYSGLEQVDLQQASVAVLNLLRAQLDEQQIQDEALNKRMQQASNEGADAEQAEVFSNQDQAYTIISESELLEGGGSGLVAVVKSQSDASSLLPFKVLDWKVNTQSLSLFAETMEVPIITVENEFTNDD